ncbi:MAG: LacI family DNA-binding transcriptional regulator [Christensenellales bacterium]
MSKATTVKLKDLAMELGLSISTISRALNGNGRVSEKTRERVFQAVKRSNYTPNAVARSLRKQNAMSIGIIVTDITNSFFASVIKGVQNVSRQKGYSILLSNSDENEQFEKEAMQLMLEKQVTGLILASVGNNAKKIEMFSMHRVPVVFIDNIPSGLTGYDSVTTDNYQAAYALTDMLIHKGYRHIGMITGPLNQSSGLQRYKGFAASMAEHGLQINPDWIKEGDFKLSSGAEAMTEILNLGERDQPQAMIVSNNYMTYGAVRAIKAKGRSIPKDIAVVSFDTEDITSLTTLAITSMNQASEEIGTKAAEVLISRMQSPDAHPHVNLVLEPVFVEGNSW